MRLLTPHLRDALRAHATDRLAAQAAGAIEPDPAPLVKFFNPCGAATWLATELAACGDVLFGLADLGFGCPELGSFSLGEIERLRLPFGLTIERDLRFETPHPLSVWADAARTTGSIACAEAVLARLAPSHPLPPAPDYQGDGTGG